MAAEGNGFEESVYYYSRLMQHIKWKDLGQILVGGVTQPGDIREMKDYSAPTILGNPSSNRMKRISIVLILKSISKF